MKYLQTPLKSPQGDTYQKISSLEGGEGVCFIKESTVTKDTKQHIKQSLNANCLELKAKKHDTD